MSTHAQRRQSLGWTPIGMRLEEAAAHVGVGLTKFQEWVLAGVMPKPKRRDGVVRWDRDALDAAFKALPDEDAKSPWGNPRL